MQSLGVIAEAQVEMLQRGSKFLSASLDSAGFLASEIESGKGSGGPAAWRRFVNGNRDIEVHFRLSLGLVSYQWNDVALSHGELLRALGIKGTYPGFSTDPMDGFKHLAADLSGPLAPFVHGDFEWWQHAIATAAQPPQSRLP